MITGDFFQKLRARDRQTEEQCIRFVTPKLVFFFRKHISGAFPLEDLVQNTLLALFKGLHLEKIPDHNSFIPFLYGIAKRNIYNYFYESKKSSTIQEKLPHIEKLAVENIRIFQFDDERQLELVQKKISQLTEIDRIILSDFFFHQKSIEEIASRIKRSKHYVSVRKERALKKIRGEISGAKNV